MSVNPRNALLTGNTLAQERLALHFGVFGVTRE